MKPRKFPLTATVDRMVTDTISLEVMAHTEQQAYDKARAVLDKFPEPHNQDGVPMCYVSNRQYHLPELIDISDQEDIGVA